MKKSIFTQISAWALLFVLVFSFAGCATVCEHKYQNGKCTECNASQPKYTLDCKHVWVDADGNKTGRCTKCNLSQANYTIPTCAHEYVNGLCGLCGAAQPGYKPVCDHTYQKGVCTKCGLYQDGYIEPKCEHTFENGSCTQCNLFDPDYVEPVCTHTFVEGRCTKCNLSEEGYVLPVCTHEFANGRCTKCNISEEGYVLPVCTHEFANGRCTKCNLSEEGYVLPVCTHEFANGRCTKCNLSEEGYVLPVCEHTYDVGVCTKCNAFQPGYVPPACQHTYVNGQCTQCNVFQPGYVPPQSGGVIVDDTIPGLTINPNIGKTDTYDPADVAVFTDITTRSATGSNGAVTSGSPWASKIGLEILQAGGNAYDAAVAIAFALGVTEVGSSGIGGGGLMVGYNANTKQSVFYNFREFAGANAKTGMTVSRPGTADGRKIAGRGVAVPTEVAGCARILEDLGTMSLRDVMQPAINLARYGFILDSRCASNIGGGDLYFLEWAYDDLAPIFTSDGISILKKGERLTQTALADVLEYIANNGAAAFYTGELAQHIVKEIQATGGHVTMEDMLYAYQNYPKISDPLKGTYAAETGNNYDILTVKHPSSGGKMLIEMFNMLECYDGNSTSLGEKSAEYINLIATIERLSEGDRNKYMGDYSINPATGEPFATDYTVGLTSKAYAAERFQKYTPGTAYKSSSSGVYYGDPSKYNDVNVPVSNIDALVEEGTDTTSFAVQDKYGNLVAWTQTLQSTLGSGVVPTGTGFLLNNQMTDFSTSTSGVNIIKPYKQPASSMTPTVLLKNGQPFAAFGSPGGKEICSGVFCVALWLMDWDKGMQDAINAGRLIAPVGSTIEIESSWGSSAKAALEAMGYTVSIQAHSTSVQGIKILPDGSFEAGADKRRGAKGLAF